MDRPEKRANLNSEGTPQSVADSASKVVRKKTEPRKRKRKKPTKLEERVRK